LGKNDVAMNWLEKAYTDRSNALVFLKVEPELDPLRTIPLYLAAKTGSTPELIENRYPNILRLRIRVTACTGYRKRFVFARIDDFVAASAEHGFEHKEAEALHSAQA